MGGACEKLDQADQALEAYRKAVDADPEDPDSRRKQCRLLRRLRRFDEAEGSIRQAIEKSADKTLLQDELGRTLAARGKLEDALAVADGLKAEETRMELLVAVYAIAGKREEALQALQRLLEQHPERHGGVAGGDELEEFRKSPAVQELLRNAGAKVRK